MIPSDLVETRALILIEENASVSVMIIIVGITRKQVIAVIEVKLFTPNLAPIVPFRMSLPIVTVVISRFPQIIFHCCTAALSKIWVNHVRLMLYLVMFAAIVNNFSWIAGASPAIFPGEVVDSVWLVLARVKVGKFSRGSRLSFFSNFILSALNCDLHSPVNPVCT